MRIDHWLAPERILLGHEATDVAEVATAAAAAIAAGSAVSAAEVERVLGARVRDGGFAIGHGVAVPHAELDGLDAAVGALVVTREPLEVGALDGEPVDLFFAVVAQPSDPTGHLRLLADLALLSKSTLLRSALRRAESADQAWELLEVAARRQTIVPTAGAVSKAEASHCMAIVAVTGEDAVDAFVLELIAGGFQAASVLEAQRLEDAAASEVPLFAGFRDLFGDPGGQRIFFLELEARRADWLVEIVRRTCEQRGGTAARVTLIPLGLRWSWQPEAAASPPGSHG